MDRMNLPPTRYNLLKLKKDYSALKVGHDLLEQKREALLEEVKRELMAFRQLESSVQGEGRKALESLAKAEAAAAPQLGMLGRTAVEVEVGYRSIMGVKVAMFKLEQRPTGKLTWPPGSEHELVELAAADFYRYVQSLARLAELQGSIINLLKEMNRMQRRVNALENIFLPQYEETISYISESLEEREREELITLKALKGK